MKWLLMVVLIVGAGGYVALRGAAPMGWTSTTPLRDVVTHDIDGFATRQVSIRVEREDQSTATHSVTLFGPTRQVIEPWLRIEAKIEGLVLYSIDGSDSRIAEGMSTVTYDLATRTWVQSAASFPDFELPPLDDGRPLITVLVDQFPEDRALLEGALGAGGS